MHNPTQFTLSPLTPEEVNHQYHFASCRSAQRWYRSVDPTVAIVVFMTCKKMDRGSTLFVIPWQEYRCPHIEVDQRISFTRSLNNVSSKYQSL
jgi:hypothetical protein